MTRKMSASALAVLWCVTVGCPSWAAEGAAGPAAFKQVAPRLTMSEPAVVPPGAQLYQRGPALVYGDGAYLLVWQDGYNGLGGDSNILAMLLDREGKPLGQPVAVCAAKAVQDSPAVAYCPGAKKFLVAWADFRNGADYDVYAAVVEREGPLDLKAGKEFVISGGRGGQAGPSVGADEAGNFLVLWRDFRGGQRFESYGARVSAADGKLLDPEGFRAGGTGRIAFGPGGPEQAGAKKFLAVSGDTARLIDPAGQVGEPITLWSRADCGGSSVTAAYGKFLAFANVSAHVSPWGWNGNGSILGFSVTADGRSPENDAARHAWGEAAANQADRVTKNTLHAARWKNHNGWPQGMPGGFKGSHSGTWPNGPTAAAFNGRSVLVVWTEANFLDILRIANRDLYLKRVLDNWACVDEPAIKLVTGPTEETRPVLASDGAGGKALLAYERQEPSGGVVVEYRLLVEEEDTQPPQLAYIRTMSDTQLILGFDEPIDPASVKPEAFSIDGAAIKSAEFNADGPALQREVKLQTDPLTPGRSYRLAVKGVTDRFNNPTRGEPFEHVARPGAAQRSDFIERWLVVGPFPANYEVDYLDSARVHPSPGDAVKVLGDEELKAAMPKVAPADPDASAKPEPADPTKTFGGQKTWKKVDSLARCFVRFSDLYGPLGMALAAANTYVYSDKDRDVLVRVDSNDGNRVWLNGKIIAFNPQAPRNAGRGFHDRTDEIPARLNKGWNQLLIEVDNHVGLWLIVAQITDPAGQPIPDLTYQLENPRK